MSTTSTNPSVSAPSTTSTAAARPRVLSVGSGLVAISFLWLFWRWFMRQGELSIAQMEDWGHALVIPLISGYMIWMVRDRIARAEVRVFWPAFIPLLVGIQAYAYTLLMVSNHMLQGLSLVLTLGSVVLFLTGPAMLRHLFLPIAYLVLMITVSKSIMIDITFKLQQIATQGSWVMLNLIGEPLGLFSVDISGNTLMIVTSTGVEHPLNVAEACSGMRMVVAFYALAGAVALLGCSQWWQRIALVLIAGPVAVFMNMIRVTVLGLLTLEDANLAAGDAHTLIGTLLLIPSLGVFLLVVWILNKIVGTDQGAATGVSS